MNPEVKAKWVAALRSGEYKQTEGQLRDGNKFCCLGVLCNLHAQTFPSVAAKEKAVESYRGSTGALPKTVRRWAGLKSDIGAFLAEDGFMSSLAELNDDGTSFKKLAKIIEAKL